MLLSSSFFLSISAFHRMVISRDLEDVFYKWYQDRLVHISNALFIAVVIRLD